jgi:hypothetical protein
MARVVLPVEGFAASLAVHVQAFQQVFPIPLRLNAISVENQLGTTEDG